jgi:rod shape-determining protein MreD
MTMKTVKLIAFFFLIYILQMLISRFSIFGVRPDLILITITLIGVNYGAEEGFVAGLVAGICQDLLGGHYFYNTLSKSLLGFLVGTFKESVLGTEEAVNLTAVVAATVTVFFIEILCLYFFFGKPFASFFILFVTLFVSCILNGLLAFISFPALKRVANFIYEAA